MQTPNCEVEYSPPWEKSHLWTFSLTISKARVRMQTIWLKYKKIFGLAFIIITTYLLLRPKKYDHTAFVIVPKINPSEAWEFVADFSNMKYLNPTIVDFNILSESGNYEHWKYSAEYSENLSHWPYLSNMAIAHFDVKALRKQDIYLVLSSHNTCLLGGLICLKTTSEFKFFKSGSTEGTVCEEHIQYECPPLLSGFCQREVIFQRTAIMDNLKRHFVN